MYRSEGGLTAGVSHNFSPTAETAKQTLNFSSLVKTMISCWSFHDENALICDFFRLKTQWRYFHFLFLKNKKLVGLWGLINQRLCSVCPPTLELQFWNFSPSGIYWEEFIEFLPFAQIRKLTAKCCFNCFSLHLIHIFLWHVQNSIIQNARHNQNIAKTT